MSDLIFNPEIWLAAGFFFIILEMTLDGSMAFFLPLGIGCAFTAAGLSGCSESISNLCTIYDRWYGLIATTGVESTAAAVLLRRAFQSKKGQDEDVNKY